MQLYSIIRNYHLISTPQQLEIDAIKWILLVYVSCYCLTIVNIFNVTIGHNTYNVVAGNLYSHSLFIPVFCFLYSSFSFLVSARVWFLHWHRHRYRYHGINNDCPMEFFIWNEYWYRPKTHVYYYQLQHITVSIRRSN